MRIAHWLSSGAIGAQSAAVRVRICGRRWVKLGALTAPGRKRGGERSQVWAQRAGCVVVLAAETRWGNHTDAPEMGFDPFFTASC